MKYLVASSLICWLGSPLLAACAGAGTHRPPQPAVLAESTQPCRAQLSGAVRELTGKVVDLAADSFMGSDSVVLSTFGQAASGRMMPPTEILRLELASHGCQLRIGDHDRTVALPQCACRAVAGK